MPVWLAPASQLPASWQYDGSGQPLGAGVDTAADGVSDVPANASGVGAPLGAGAPAVAGGGLQRWLGCDVRVEVRAGDNVASSHLCVDVFFNVSPGAVANANVEQVCAQFASGVPSPLMFTALPDGCDASLATGVCTRSQELTTGYRARYDTYYYDTSYDSRLTRAGEVCRAL